MKHEWFRDVEKPEHIFNKIEIDIIKHEFTYIPKLSEVSMAERDHDVEAIKRAIASNLQKPSSTIGSDLNKKPQLFAFGYTNLQSTEDAEEGNILHKSEILAPFNSSMSSTGLEEYAEMKGVAEYYNKQNVMFFEHKA